jgi:hypothetical protein
VKTNRLLLTNTTVMGVATRELWNHEPEMPRWQWSELMPLLKLGVLDPVIGAQFSIQRTGSAIRTIDERRAAGKFSCVFGSASTGPTVLTSPSVFLLMLSCMAFRQQTGIPPQAGRDVGARSIRSTQIVPLNKPPRLQTPVSTRSHRGGHCRPRFRNHGATGHYDSVT